MLSSVMVVTKILDGNSLSIGMSPSEKNGLFNSVLTLDLEVWSLLMEN